MRELKTMLYKVDGRVARITLNRPDRGNGITFDLQRELVWCVEQVDLDPRVHLMAFSGAGKGFCGGYVLVLSAETKMQDDQDNNQIIDDSGLP